MASPKIAPAFTPAVEHLRATLKSIRTGRAAIGLVEPLTVECYGTTTRLKEMASLTTPDAKTIQIEPWDPSTVAAVQKALETSSLGMNPTVVGKIIRLAVPSLTEERRKEMTKLVRTRAEDSRIAIRNIREKLLHELKRNQDQGVLSNDAWQRRKDLVQKDVDEALRVVEEAVSEKERELLTP